MSWFRSAINKAAEVGGKNIAPNLSRTVRTVAQQAGHAVAGGAKLVQDRLSGRNLNSLKHAVRRLDEVALNARGAERVQALARWLAALKEIGRDITLLSQVEESKSVKIEDITVPGATDEVPSPRRASMVFFYDFENDGEPINFREVFLRSHAIENIVTSMILEAPVDEEVTMLLEMFGLCLAGGKELHNAIISSIQDLAKAFASYTEEVMTKKEDLLKYAQDAVTGLKLNADVERLDAQIAFVKQQIAEKQGGVISMEDAVSLKLPVGVAQNASGEVFLLLTESSKKSEEILDLGLKLGDMLQRKKHLLHGGDSPKARADKVDLLKSVTGSLNKSTAETEKLITENRNQKEAALRYRATKAQEVEEVEKAVAAEVKILEKKRDELEAELKEVKAALGAVTSRHINTQEEKEQFDEASTNVVAHLVVQEEELTRSLAARKVENGVIGTWLSFLEDTWHLQTTYTEQNAKDIEHALGEAKEKYLQSVITNLSYRKEELNILLKQLKFCSDEINATSNKRGHMDESGMDSKAFDTVKEKRKIQEKFLEAEGQVSSILKAVDVLKKDLQSYGTITPGNATDLEKSVLEAFQAINEIQSELGVLPRPELELVSTTSTSIQATSTSKPSVRWADISGGSHDNNTTHQSMPAHVSAVGASHIHTDNELPKDGEIKFMEAAEEEDSTELQPEERKDVEEYSLDETAGWEFDELEEELNREAA